MNVGAPELLIILAVVLLIFGPTKLPGLARSLGAASREFRKGLSHHDTAHDETSTEKAEPPNPARSIPESELVVLPDAGHVPTLSRPETVARVIEEFADSRDNS